MPTVLSSVLRLDVLSSLLAVASIWSLGRKKWWGWLFNIANIPVLTFVNAKYGLWAFHFLNAGLGVLYVQNLFRWKRGEAQ